MSRGSRLVRNTLILGLGRLLPQILALVTLPIYTRYLDPSEYGTFDLMTTYVTLLLPIVTVNLDQAVFRFLIDIRDSPNRQAECVTTVTLTSMASTLCLLAVCAIANLWIDLSHGPMLIGYVAAMAVSSLAFQSARGYGRNGDYAIASVLASVVTVVVSVGLVIEAGLGVDGMLCGLIAGNLVGAACLTVRLRLDKLVRFRWFRRGLLTELMAYSAPLIPNGVAWWLVNLSSRTVIAVALGASATGLFGIASRWSTPIAGIVAVVSLAWTEAASLEIATEDRNDFFSQVFDTWLRVIGSASLVLIAAAAVLFDVLIGPDFHGAYPYVPVLVTGAFASGLASQYGAAYIAAKRSMSILGTTLIAGLSSIAVTGGLIWSIGLWAPALAAPIAFGLMAALRHSQLGRLGLSLKYDRKLLVQLVIAAAAVVAAYYGQSRPSAIAGVAVAILSTGWFLRHLARQAITARRSRPPTDS